MFKSEICRDVKEKIFYTKQCKHALVNPQAAQTLFVIYIRDRIAYIHPKNAPFQALAAHFCFSSVRYDWSWARISKSLVSDRSNTTKSLSTVGRHRSICSMQIGPYQGPWGNYTGNGGKLATCREDESLHSPDRALVAMGRYIRMSIS